MGDLEKGLELLPREMVSYPVGFAMDIGGSVTKLIYRDKKDSKKGGLRSALIERNDIQKLVTFIKNNVDMNISADNTCTVTGMGIKSYGEEIEKKLGMKIDLKLEFDCSIKAFQYFSKLLPRDQFFAPVSRTAFEQAYNTSMEWAKGFAKVPEVAVDFSFSSKIPSCDVMFEGYSKNSDAIYPCIIATLGSGFNIVALHEDGKTEVLDYSNRGGRTFLGLGAIITGAKTYDELVDLASKGDPQKCNTLVRDIHQSTDTEDFYGMMPSQANCFFFGEAMGKSRDEFRREDLAITLLDYICHDLCQFIVYVSKVKDIPKVYFMGSFLNDEITRETLTRVFLERANMRRDMKLVMRIVPLGAQFPALGAWLLGCEKILKED